MYSQQLLLDSQILASPIFAQQVNDTYLHSISYSCFEATQLLSNYCVLSNLFIRDPRSLSQAKLHSSV